MRTLTTFPNSISTQPPVPPAALLPSPSPVHAVFRRWTPATPASLLLQTLPWSVYCVVTDQPYHNHQRLPRPARWPAHSASAPSHPSEPGAPPLPHSFTFAALALQAAIHRRRHWRSGASANRTLPLEVFDTRGGEFSWAKVKDCSLGKHKPTRLTLGSQHRRRTHVSCRALFLLGWHLLPVHSFGRSHRVFSSTLRLAAERLLAIVPVASSYRKKQTRNP